MGSRINIAIADDHVLVRQGIVTMLNNEPSFNVIFEANNGKELLEKLKDKQPHIILLDIRMPEMDGREALLKIKQKYPSVNVIILSMHYNEAYIIQFMSQGASGFLSKSCQLEEFVEAIHKVYNNDIYLSPDISTHIYDQISLKNKRERDALHSKKTLTKKQIKVLKLLYEEKSPDEIAKILFISRRTVEWHKNKMFEKTGAKNIIGVIKYAINNGLI